MTLISETVDKVAWLIFQAINLTWSVIILLAVVTGYVNSLQALAVVVLSLVIQHVIIHVWNYGFHRMTEEQAWENSYDASIATRDKLNRRATLCWMIGMQKHALTLIEHADYAWLEAQITLADEENPRNAQPLHPHGQTETEERLR